MSIPALRHWFFRLILAAAAAACLIGPARADDQPLAIVRVLAGWRDAASFKRISEYFNGRENTGGETVLRTQAGQRAGFYFVVRLANPGTARPVRLSLQLITSADAKPATYDFSTDLKSGASIVNLGLTGADWADPKANPVAWKLDVIADDGRVLATEKSYLWEKPAGR